MSAPETSFWRLDHETRAGLVWALNALESYMEEGPLYPGMDADRERLAKLKLEIDPTHKRCPFCGPQLISEFYVQRKTKYGDYLQAYCKKCSNEKREKDRLRKKARQGIALGK